MNKLAKTLKTQQRAKFGSKRRPMPRGMTVKSALDVLEQRSLQLREQADKAFRSGRKIRATSFGISIGKNLTAVRRLKALLGLPELSL
jgi:hypothetical protein